ncbi:hypothetical protein SASPL_154851 [Salvia splendens]|uniref:S-locus glycoprotein domain-containing protein n=1 Tax=Salvia splendens TaxID=180675 RepID=A0A8X8W0U3_SALSN|nr:hypothetical protein SASPL_154851 [Salvia splendens]
MAPPVADREPDRPPPQRHEEVFSPEFCDNLFGVQPLIANGRGPKQLIGNGCMSMDSGNNESDMDSIFVDIKLANDSLIDQLGSEALNITYGVITADDIEDDECLTKADFCTDSLSQLRISPPAVGNTNVLQNIVIDVAADSGVAHEKIVSVLESVDDIVPSDTRGHSYGVVRPINLTQPVKDPQYGERLTLSYVNAMKSWPNQPYLFCFGGLHLFILVQALIYDARLIPPRDDALLLGGNPIMLRNCVAEPGDDFIKVPNAIRQRCDPSYYTIYMRETSEYRSHEDAHGKSYVWCVPCFNKVRTSSGVLGNYSMDLRFVTARIGILFKFQLFKVQDLHSLGLIEFGEVSVHSDALCYNKYELLLNIGLLYLGRLLHSQLNNETKSWYVTWLAPSNECDIYETWRHCGSCKTQALEMCSYLSNSGDGFQKKGDDTCVHGNGARTIRVPGDNNSNCGNAGGPLPFTEMGEFCHEQVHHTSNLDGLWPSAVTYELLIDVFWDSSGTQTSRLFRVLPPLPLSCLQLPYSVVYFLILSQRKIMLFRDRVAAAMIELHMVDGDIPLTTLIKDRQMLCRAVLVRDFHNVKVRKYGKVIQVGDGVIELRHAFSTACRACDPCPNEDWEGVQTVFLLAAGKFQVGDNVILILRPYDQHHLEHLVAAMFDRCFYGPLAIVGCIGEVVIWSQLLRKHFPNLRLVDKAIFMGGGVDRDSTSCMIQLPSPSPTSSLPDEAEEDVPRKEVEKKSGRKERPKREASKSVRYGDYVSH